MEETGRGGGRDTGDRDTGDAGDRDTGDMRPGQAWSDVDVARSRFPFCVVWTPIPCLSWFVPFIGHMGIAMSSGVIRDFAGPYYVSEDNMAFGNPTRYWMLEPSKIGVSHPNAWDKAISEASEEYKHRMHNLCCDNCHSHVAMALNLMRYGGRDDWGMVRLCVLMLVRGRHVSMWGFLKTWLPFTLMVTTAVIISAVLRLGT
ncbi:transmembrane protein 222 [Petromyzon marinus]|uniref:Transmembrane protein 222 n=1 Tax=Petromyzon marinus TaxID=7757 RepID=A0AAJ7X7N3_PETMA|nr:transmembrane protein 222 [Petromyzon marinus]